MLELSLPKRALAVLATAALLTPAALTTATAVPADTPAAPRTVITTDPELDDLNSMLRLLLYSNEIRIAGLVYSASQHHYSGNAEEGVPSKRWPDPSSVFHIDTAVNAYETAYPNLVVHDSAYPTPQHLRSLIAWGNVEYVGEMSKDTDGSRLIRDILLDDEPGQVFLQAWGGPNTIARALKSIDEDYRGTPEWAAIYAKIVKKAVITSWGQQDTTFRDYIKPNWPELENREVATSIWGYGARGSAAPEDQVYLSPEWTYENVSSVGPIGAEYRVWGDGKQMAAGFDNEDYFGLSGYTAAELRAMGYLVWTPPQPKGAWISEGDSSNFALLIDNGLRNWQHPSWGGWGGRQQVSATDPVSWTNRGVQDIGPAGTPRNDWAAARWFSDFQHDFAARLQWTVTPDYADANHEPVVSVPPGRTNPTARPGERVQLVGQASDPDGDNLTVSWWQYHEADTYPGLVSLENPSALRGKGASFVVPEDAEPGQTIHLILEVTDDGELPLQSYQRVVVTVR
jgi:hypothetical protein